MYFAVNIAVNFGLLLSRDIPYFLQRLLQEHAEICKCLCTLFVHIAVKCSNFLKLELDGPSNLQFT